LAASAQLLDEMARAVERLRAAAAGNVSLWREAAVESSAVLSRGVAELLASVNRPAGAEAHLRAQRFARVRIAEIQLYHAAQVKSGRASGNLYGALSARIDAAREAYRQLFLTPAGGIPDYVHQELVKTLANDDAALLGPAYPGPMA
jgi:hypothetical protein